MPLPTDAIKPETIRAMAETLWRWDNRKTAYIGMNEQVLAPYIALVTAGLRAIGLFDRDTDAAEGAN